MKAAPTTTADLVRAVLTRILDTHLAGRPEPTGESEALAFCETVGIWPMPPEHAARVSALRMFAARVLPLFDADKPQDYEGRCKQNLFDYWRKLLDAEDKSALHTTVIFLRLWSRRDSISLGWRA